MLIKLLGALLVISAGAAAGLGRSRTLRGRVAQAEAVAAALELLETEVCRLHTPLPEALARLAQLGERFAPLLALSAAGETRAFSERWAESLERLALGGELRELLWELTRALARGGDPARAFAVARERLELLLRGARQEAAEKCRLSSALGLCAGLLLAILLA